MHRPGVRFAHQATFHPLKYLEPLVRAIPGDGSFVFAHTAMEEVDDKPMVVQAGGRTIRCDYLVIATHNPVMGKKGRCSGAPDQTRPLYQLRAGRARAERDRAGRAVVGYQRPV